MELPELLHDFFPLCCFIIVTMDLNLQPDIKAIKKRMEDLITRDYLERDKENPNVFKYLAQFKQCHVLAEKDQIQKEKIQLTVT